MLGIEKLIVRSLKLLNNHPYNKIFKIFSISNIYETEPLGYKDQPLLG